MVNDLRSPPPRVRERHGPVATAAAAGSVAAAGAVHLAVVPQHLDEYLLFGLFFGVVGGAQLVAAAVLLTGAGRRMLAAVAAAQILLVLLWW
ncbi:MAG TPA: hypothetical protein VGE11_20820, partial [Pseudonocardia sp.]